MRQRLSIRAVLFLVLVCAGGLSTAALCSSYESKASDIVNDGQKQVEEIGAAAQADMSACSVGQMDACDRTMTSLSAMADELETMRGELSELKPSKDATQWHTDYLAMVDKMLWLIRSTTAAWDAGDFAAVIAMQGPFAELELEEARLIEYFNDNLR